MAAPRKLVVEIFGARNLVSIDGTGSTSAFCTLDYDQSQKKSTTKNNDLNPTWGEKFDFSYGNGLGVLDINVYDECEGGTRQDGFLGRVQIKVSNVKKQGQGALKWLRLETKSVFPPIQIGELGVHVWFEDLKSPPPEPKLQAKPEPKEPPPLKKEAKPRLVNKVTPAEFKVKDVVRKTGEAALDHQHNNDAVRKTRETALDHQRNNDLVEPMMQYLYVKVVKARNLAAKGADGSSDPYVKVSVSAVSEVSARTQVIRKDLNPEWDRVFAFSKDKLQGQFLEISVWGADIEDEADHFLGALSFFREEIPLRKPPDSPLASLWYKLEGRPGKTGVKGDLKMALWMGNFDDEAFQYASHPDPDLDFGGRAHLHLRPKVYRSPTMWYLRVSVLEARDLYTSDAHTYRDPQPVVGINLGLVQSKSVFRPYVTGDDPVWNKDLLFVAAEPFDELLVVTVKDRVGPNKEEVMGVARISIGAISRRLDFRQQIDSSWHHLETMDKGVYRGRIHLRLHFEGGYHVFDEGPDTISCTRPSAEQPGIPPLGMLELGIIGASNLVPMHKIASGRVVTDAYCVAKYGQKWFRTSTIPNKFSPKWNEQYTWEVYDPFTVLTVCIFDNRNVHNRPSLFSKDTPIGKIKIRLSNLEINRVYNTVHPLLVVTASGIKKLGGLELSVRFSCASTLNIMRAYLRPSLPALHYSMPIEWSESEDLRIAAMNVVASRLACFKPPLRQEVIQFMLDTESNRFCMRRSKANYFRIANVLSQVFALHKRFDDICTWKSPVTTVSVHVFCLVLVWYPELQVPILFLYMFLVGAWNYPFRSRSDPSLISVELSRGGFEDITDLDELEEEFNVMTQNKTEAQVLKKRYERLRGFAGRIQNFLSVVSTQGERLQSLLCWRDRRATLIFVIFCLIAAIVHYITPLRVVAQVLIIFYVLRHPKFRDPFPSIPLNFFGHLPSLSDRIL